MPYPYRIQQQKPRRGAGIVPKNLDTSGEGRVVIPRILRWIQGEPAEDRPQQTLIVKKESEYHL